MEVLVTPKHAPEADAFERAMEIMQHFGFIRIYSYFKVFNSLEPQLWKAQ